MEYKIVILGDMGVGKTNLLIQMIQNHYLAGDNIGGNDPTIEDSYRKLVSIDQETCLLDIFDSVTDFTPEGEVEASAQLNMYVNNEDSVGFILAYSVTSRKSFKSILKYRDWIVSQRRSFLINHQFPVALIATMSDDTEREVSIEEGENLARECLFNCPFIECSSKERKNIEESFYSVVREIRKELILKGQYHKSPSHAKKKHCFFL